MSTQATLTLADFLLARLAEDEAATARKDMDGVALGPIESADGYAECSISAPRVLAECEAKRQIVAEHGPVVNPLTPDITYCRMCVSHAGFGATSKTEDTGQIDPCRTLRLLASVYADHPDYRDEWRV